MTPSEQIDDLLNRAGEGLSYKEALRQVDDLRQTVTLTEEQSQRYEVIENLEYQQHAYDDVEFYHSEPDDPR